MGLKEGRPTVSSRCDTGACVEVELLEEGDAVALRDSTVGEPGFEVPREAYRAFLGTVAAGNFVTPAPEIPA